MGACSSSEGTTDAVAKQEITDIDRATLDLKNARDRLQRYRNKLEQDDAKLLTQAKKAKERGQTEQALGILRLKKYKQAQAAACEDQLLNVMKMVETIDSKQNEAQVLSAMAAGKDTLQKMHEETTVEDVLNLMDSIQEQADTEQEINDLLQGVPSLSPADEAAVEAELEALIMMQQKDEEVEVTENAVDPKPQQEATTAEDETETQPQEAMTEPNSSADEEVLPTAPNTELPALPTSTPPTEEEAPVAGEAASAEPIAA